MNLVSKIVAQIKGDNAEAKAQAIAQEISFDLQNRREAETEHFESDAREIRAHIREVTVNKQRAGFASINYADANVAAQILDRKEYANQCDEKIARLNKDLADLTARYKENMAKIDEVARELGLVEPAADPAASANSTDNVE